MKLKLSEMANIAEIVAAVAIVVSLIYVGVQVNDSTRAVRSATANDISAAMSSWYITVGSDSQASQIFYDGMRNPDSLSRQESAQYVFLTHGLFLEYQAAFYLSQEGTLDSSLLQSLVNTIAGVREMPGMLRYWEQRRDLFEADFREFVDDLLANGTTNKNIELLYQGTD